MYIQKITASEILDSRGNPTILAIVHTDNKLTFSASVPSGASTGDHEAHELRDNDSNRFGGAGVTMAVTGIKTEISAALEGKDVSEQSTIDQIMIDLDASPSKSRLGSNAILAVSMAVSRAGANSANLPLYKYISHLAKTKPSLPRPCFNVINGGVHAGNMLGYQEFMISPKADSLKKQVRMASEIYHSLKSHLNKTYGGPSTLLGDEGGFAPPIKEAREALETLEQVISVGPHKGQVEYALDVAASEFYSDGQYNPNFKQSDSNNLSPEQLLKEYQKLVEEFPIFSIEDPFDQDAFESFAQLNKIMSPKGVRVVGDDLTVTNTDRINMAVKHDSCNTLLLKINQIGTITESISAFTLAKENDWQVMVSHRSGETTDDYIADLAVGLGAEYIKSGGLARGERIVKYNRLLLIEDELNGHD